MFHWFWRGKIRNTLLAAFLVITLVPALLAVAVGYHYTARSVTNLSFENLKGLTDEKAEFIETWFFEKANLVRYLAGTEEIKQLDPVRIKPVLERVLDSHPDYVNLMVADSRGITVVDAINPPGADLSQQPYVKAALNGKDYISEVMDSLFNQKPVVALASPVKEADRVIGVFLGIIDIERINGEINKSYHGRTGETFLVRRDGLMITESRFAPDLINGVLLMRKPLWS